MTRVTRVSIVTRTKNRPLLLRRAIASAIAQTLPAWQMLIVNDGGDPAPVDALVAEAAARADGRIRVFHNDQSRGMEAASNLALSHATADYVVIHDDDDSWEPGFLAACVEHMDAADQSVGGVVTYSTKVTERLTETEVVVQATEPYMAGIRSIGLMEMARGNMFPPIAFLYRRSVLAAVGSYRADLPVLGDWEFNLRVLAVFDLEVIPKPLANYHLRPATQSGIYSNTIIGGVSTHQKYEAKIRNEMLRNDLRAGRMGMGFLTNMARLLNDHLWEMRRGQMLETTLGRLRAQGLSSFAVYGAGELGRQVTSAAQARGFTVQHIVDRNQGLWGTPIEGVTVVGLDQALENGCETFLIASLTFAREIRESIGKAVSARGIDARVFEMDQAA